MISYSLLDLAILAQNETASAAYRRSLDVAQLAEKLGFSRYWLAEHHNMPHVGSSAPTILMGYIAQGTTKIRVGSGGIMLPNHSPLVVAEQIGTLESLYPGRIDLGLGRAPGTDQQTASVLRRGRLESVHEFPADLQALKAYFSGDLLDHGVRAFPAEGLEVPIYLLGSSMSSAVLAAQEGLPYAFASHFAPSQFLQAANYYRTNFKHSPEQPKPYMIACVNVIAADTVGEAEYLATSFYQMALGIIRGRSYPLMPPVEDMSQIWTPQEAAAIQQMMAVTYIGTKSEIKAGLARLIELSKIDEIMVTTSTYEHRHRLKSLRLTAEAIQELNEELIMK